MTSPKATMTSLFKFILNVQDLQGANIEKYVDIAVKENQPPEIYKPREGKVNINTEKFTQEHLAFMFSYA